MADIGKREDAMLEEISKFMYNRDQTKALLDLYMEGGLLLPQVASHLWEVLNGFHPEPEEGSLAESNA